ncbi:tetratricopeptide repeat protein [uncultured Cohaesibacter sp.]|uniref:tetratricopeptide repeat protein n=1 Tax=uncultured Cohaesibacter sp. TaxID=1002546 RepID=UPI0029C6CAB9|nr:tetratricopeptide repeat protein [uncultured Cohaesibacter sp.]
MFSSKVRTPVAIPQQHARPFRHRLKDWRLGLGLAVAWTAIAGANLSADLAIAQPQIQPAAAAPPARAVSDPAPQSALDGSAASDSEAADQTPESAATGATAEDDADGTPDPTLNPPAAITDPSNPFDVPRFVLKSTSAYSAYQRGFYLTAFALATKLAGLGDVPSQTLLGNLYLDGSGIPQDFKEAANWFALAADQGDREAQFSLGMLYARGQGVDKDLQKALGWFEKAAAQDQKNAQFNLGLLYLQGQLVEQDTTKALDLLTKAANQGVAEAQYTLANLYQSDYFPTPNLDQAAYWMQLAAQNGFLDAQLEFGLMLFQGKGVAQDFAAARAWIKQAADAGSILAQNRLARILARGYGEPPAPVDAAKYYLLSKRAGKTDDWLEKFFKELPDAEKQLAIKELSSRTFW